MMMVDKSEAARCAKFGVPMGDKVMIPDSMERLYLKCAGNPLPLGDWVAKVTKVTGIAAAVKAVAGDNCGCGARQEKLNRLGARVARALA